MPGRKTRQSDIPTGPEIADAESADTVFVDRKREVVTVVRQVERFDVPGNVPGHDTNRASRQIPVTQCSEFAALVRSVIDALPVLGKQGTADRNPGIRFDKRCQLLRRQVQYIDVRFVSRYISFDDDAIVRWRPVVRAPGAALGKHHDGFVVSPDCLYVQVEILSVPAGRIEYETVAPVRPECGTVARLSVCHQRRSSARQIEKVDLVELRSAHIPPIEEAVDTFRRADGSTSYRFIEERQLAANSSRSIDAVNLGCIRKSCRDQHRFARGQPVGQRRRAAVFILLQPLLQIRRDLRNPFDQQRSPCDALRGCCGGGLRNCHHAWQQTGHEDDSERTHFFVFVYHDFRYRYNR